MKGGFNDNPYKIDQSTSYSDHFNSRFSKGQGMPEIRPKQEGSFPNGQQQRPDNPNASNGTNKIDQLQSKNQSNFGFAAQALRGGIAILEVIVSTQIVRQVIRTVLRYLMREVWKKSTIFYDGPIGQTRDASDSEIERLKDGGFDPHEQKPKQGGPGGKIDIWIDEAGNMFYKTFRGSHFEPFYDNMKNYIKDWKFNRKNY